MEIAVVLVAILLLFGADALPKALRTFGRWTEQIRRISMDLQRELHDAGEPFQQARAEWEEDIQNLRVDTDDPGRPRAGKPDPDAPAPPRGESPASSDPEKPESSDAV